MSCASLADVVENRGTTMHGRATAELGNKDDVCLDVRTDDPLL